MGGGFGAVASHVSGNDDDAVFNRVGEVNDGAGGGGGAVSFAGSGGLASGSGGGGGGVSGDGGAAVVNDRNECPSDNDSFIAGGERDIARGIGDRARDGGLDGGGDAVVLSVSGNDDDAVYNRVGETHDGAGGGGAVSGAGLGVPASASGGGGVFGDDVTAAVSDRNGCPSDNDSAIAGGEHDAVRGIGRSEDHEDLEENSCAPSVKKDIGTSACYAKSGMLVISVLCSCPKGVDPGPGRYIRLI